MECKSGPLISESHKLFFPLPQLLRKSETGIYLLSSEIPKTNSVIRSEGRTVLIQKLDVRQSSMELESYKVSRSERIFSRP